MMRPWRLMADQYEGDPDPDLAAYRAAGHLRYAHKATEGLYHMDVKHAARVRSAHEHGLTVLHYHYCRPDEHSPLVEAGSFWRKVKPLWKPGDRLALDFESWRGLGAVRPGSGYIKQIWVELLNRSGVKAAVYGSTSGLAEHVDARWLRRKARWQAAYGPVPTHQPWGTHWWAWQFTDGQAGPLPHTMEGIGPCDISILSMSVALADRARAWRPRYRAAGKTG